MASLFRQRLVRYVDANGKRVKKGHPGARRVAEKSRKWYGEYNDEFGVRRRVPLASDKAAAQTLLNGFVRDVERRQAGLTDACSEHAKRPLSAHIDDYKTFLLAKNGTLQHVEQTIVRINRLCEGCEFRFLTDIDGARTSTWLSDQRQIRRRFSAQTSNYYLEGFKAFCKWLVTHDRMSKSPVATLTKLSVDADRRHDRRSLSDEEFSRLVTAAQNGRTVEGLAGKDRAMLYILAAWTGYRRRELSSITRKSVEFTEQSATITVVAGYSKRRRKDSTPLHPWVIERLQEWLKTKETVPDDEPLFALRTVNGHLRKTSKMMKVDLEIARQAWIEEAPTA